MQALMHLHSCKHTHAHTCIPYRPTYKMKRNKWLEGRKTGSPIEAYVAQNPGFTL